MDNFIASLKEAKLIYFDSDYEVETPGEFVRCAVSNAPIRLEDLKYWNAEFQEAYISADYAFQRAQEKGLLAT